MARQLEEKMVQAEHERKELEEAQRSADESRRLAEEAANLEKSERELRVSIVSRCLYSKPVIRSNYLSMYLYTFYCL